MILVDIIAYPQHQYRVDGRYIRWRRQAFPRYGCDVIIHLEIHRVQTRFTGRRPLGDGSIPADHKRTAIEDQFILSTHQVDVQDRQTRLLCAQCQQLLPFTALAGMKRRGIDID